MIVLVFKSPDGKVGFTEASNAAEAVSTTKCYRAAGYRLMAHHVIQEEQP